MTTTINLQINRGLDERAIIHMGDIKDIHDHDLPKIGNLMITGVPVELEYEVSKYFFNRMEIIDLKSDNAKLAEKLSKYL